MYKKTKSLTMVKGVGIDMVEVNRMAEKISREQGFRELVFAAAEISYCEAATHKYQHYAARFAAKEAFLKAMGTGWANGTAFNEIEIVHDEQGKPAAALKRQHGSMGPAKRHWQGFPFPCRT